MSIAWNVYVFIHSFISIQP